ncbi:putative gluconeogenesis factor [Actinorhabdospora filicis]|uniref:Putative gluconeogenesis factor n=1 Tax=Actinorhabdospora filicis TaxID=1785913 RepID=A0A9W6SL18_9ACTN|nr:uridine diphosphate-N-acetylglucosamine-binding protein YvcK [Actinorhabdospora filicis]GLZ78940.1 putative gluconeogenesis factor [Actinorhabdospora filicis]
MRRPRVVAFGGGKGLSVSLRALRRLPADITAVVTVADDGGSSGRLRVDRGALPPGDLRQALAALADDQGAARLMQHRYEGTDSLSGHTVGNLMLLGLLEIHEDPVAALDEAGRMTRAHGRVLPMSTVPLRIEADIIDEHGRPGVVRGQHNVAVSRGTVTAVRLDPADPPVAAEVLDAVAHADVILFGPGSWYTSVLPHLLTPRLREAIAESRARRLLTLNLSEDTETAGLSLAGHLGAFAKYADGVTIDWVIADARAVGYPDPVESAAQSLGARLVLARVARDDGTPRHDPDALAAALRPLLETERESAATEFRRSAGE